MWILLLHHHLHTAVVINPLLYGEIIVILRKELSTGGIIKNHMQLPYFG